MPNADVLLNTGAEVLFMHSSSGTSLANVIHTPVVLAPAQCFAKPAPWRPPNVFSLPSPPILTSESSFLRLPLKSKSSDSADLQRESSSSGLSPFGIFQPLPVGPVCRFPLREIVFTARSLVMPTSLLLQIDGLLFATFRERLERDVCATSCTEAFCHFWGPGVSAASTFCGLYYPAPALLDVTIFACRAERGFGVFIMRRDSEALSSLQSEDLVLLSFIFIDTLFQDWCGVFCSFAFSGRVVRKKPHKAFDVFAINAACVPTKIGLLPFCPARVSPTPFYPCSVKDTCKASPSLDHFHGAALPVLTSPWDVSAITECASAYPFSDVAKLCVAAASSVGSTSLFAGDRSKCVLAKNSPLSPKEWDKIREKFLADVALNRMSGPFPRCPFPNDWCDAQARQISLSTRPKDKWDPFSERFRVISSLSVHKPASVNDLVFSPKLVSFHLQATNLRDTLFRFGPHALFNTIDQVEAFRSNKINLRDAHLYVYMVPRGSIEEWFFDLAACFGAIVSEWSYAVEVAVIKWSLQNDLLVVGSSFSSAALEGFVDNWFLIGSSNDASFHSKWTRVKQRFTSLGVDMHEEQLNINGPINAIGWDWDTASSVFSCPIDKLTAARALIFEWSQRALTGGVFSSLEIAKLVGLQRWVATACPIIIPSVAYIQAFGFTISVTQKAVALDARAAAAVHFLSAFFTSWNGQCPIRAGFSPIYSFEFLIRSDASTSDGCGGFCLPFTPSLCGFNACFHSWSPDEKAQALGHREDSVRESTMFLELLSLLILLEHFVPHLRARRVQFECDNESAVRALCKGFSKMPLCMKLIAQFWLICAENNIIPRFVHILAQYNTIADELSHFRPLQAEAAAISEFNVGFSCQPYSLPLLPTRL